MSEFIGKTAIVTGAGKGIGFEIARHLAMKGANLIINDLDINLVKNASQILMKNYCAGNARCVAVPGDAGDLHTIDDLVDQATSSFDHLDMVIANAGITTFGEFVKYKPTDFERLIHVNLQGSFFLCQRAATEMIKGTGGGRMLVMSSVTGHQAHYGLTAYGMTKAALQAFAKFAGVELAPHGITVNAISPGATITERTMEDSGYVTEWQNITPSGSVTTVEDIAQTAMFLLSEKSSQITGQTIIVDGGWTATSPQPK